MGTSTGQTLALPVDRRSSDHRPPLFGDDDKCISYLFFGRFESVSPFQSFLLLL